MIPLLWKHFKCWWEETTVAFDALSACCDCYVIYYEQHALTGDIPASLITLAPCYCYLLITSGWEFGFQIRQKSIECNYAISEMVIYVLKECLESLLLHKISDEWHHDLPDFVTLEASTIVFFLKYLQWCMMIDLRIMKGSTGTHSMQILINQSLFDHIYS